LLEAPDAGAAVIIAGAGSKRRGLFVEDGGGCREGSEGENVEEPHVESDPVGKLQTFILTI
jgi:hypothetical protein